MNSWRMAAVAAALTLLSPRQSSWEAPVPPAEAMKIIQGYTDCETGDIGSLAGACVTQPPLCLKEGMDQWLLSTELQSFRRKLYRKGLLSGAALGTWMEGVSCARWGPAFATKPGYLQTL